LGTANAFVQHGLMKARKDTAHSTEVIVKFRVRENGLAVVLEGSLVISYSSHELHGSGIARGKSGVDPVTRLVGALTEIVPLRIASSVASSTAVLFSARHAVAFVCAGASCDGDAGGGGCTTLILPVSPFPLWRMTFPLLAGGLRGRITRAKPKNDDKQAD